MIQEVKETAPSPSRSQARFLVLLVRILAVDLFLQVHHPAVKTRSQTGQPDHSRFFERARDADASRLKATLGVRAFFASFIQSAIQAPPSRLPHRLPETAHASTASREAVNAGISETSSVSEHPASSAGVQSIFLPL